MRADLIAETQGLGRRLGLAVARGMEGRRTELRAAARAAARCRAFAGNGPPAAGCGRRAPAQCPGANAGAHRARLLRAAGRLAPGVLRLRIDRSRDRIDALSGRAAAALTRRTETRRQGFDTLASRLTRGPSASMPAARPTGSAGPASGSRRSRRVRRAHGPCPAPPPRPPRCRDQAPRGALLPGRPRPRLRLVRDAEGRPLRSAAQRSVPARRWPSNSPTAGSPPPPRARRRPPRRSLPPPAEPKPRKAGEGKTEGQGTLF